MRLPRVWICGKRHASGQETLLVITRKDAQAL
ncbi:hypothetical protein POX_c03557 [Penicillium oxalicum]|nr:hypothetical protein POX_c03557 [Penicillium oxalicum]KAI2790711.1 hypothetical protein POX_c03557 [Penicillium oxalicum]